MPVEAPVMRAVFIKNKPKIAFCGSYQLIAPRLSLWGFGVRTFHFRVNCIIKEKTPHRP
jgi:hypothetical protein